MYQKDWSKLGPITGCFGYEGNNEAEREMLEALDPKIRRIVQILREQGLETFESCQGGKGHAYTQPTVRFHGMRGEGFKAIEIVFRNDLPVYELRRIWEVIDHEVTGPYWEITFIIDDIS